MNKATFYTLVLLIGGVFLMAANEFNETQLNDDQYLYFGDGNDVGFRWNNTSTRLEMLTASPSHTHYLGTVAYGLVANAMFVRDGSGDSETVFAVRGENDDFTLDDVYLAVMPETTSGGTLQGLHIKWDASDSRYYIQGNNSSSKKNLIIGGTAAAAINQTSDVILIDNTNGRFGWNVLTPTYDFEVNGNTFVDTGRFMQNQGADVASAGAMTLGGDGTAFWITGTTTINSIVTTSWEVGSRIVLAFASTPTVNHVSAGGGANIYLKGEANQAMGANDTLELCLIYDGTNTYWWEI